MAVCTACSACIRLGIRKSTSLWTQNRYTLLLVYFFFEVNRRASVLCDGVWSPVYGLSAWLASAYCAHGFENAMRCVAHDGIGTVTREWEINAANMYSYWILIDVNVNRIQASAKHYALIPITPSNELPCIRTSRVCIFFINLQICCTHWSDNFSFMHGIYGEIAATVCLFMCSLCVAMDVLQLRHMTVAGEMARWWLGRTFNL